MTKHEQMKDIEFNIEGYPDNKFLKLVSNIASGHPGSRFSPAKTSTMGGIF